jgi:hypothetical protein
MSQSVLVKDALPLFDKSSESILSMVKEVLQEPGLVRFVVDARQDTLDFWKVASEEQAAEIDVTFHDMLRKVMMEEYSEPNKDPFHQLFDMFEMVADAGYSPSHILSGRGPLELRKWIPISRKANVLFGVPLLFEKMMESDVLVVCGSNAQEPTAADIAYAVKVSLP